MKAITLWGPWGTWIAWELKIVETRGHDRFRCLRGERIAIHEGKRFDKTAIDLACQNLSKYLSPDKKSRRRDLLRSTAAKSRSSGGGLIVCTAVVVKARWTDKYADLAALLPPCPGRFGLLLGDIRRLKKPVPRRGRQGIWTVPDDVIPKYAR